MIIPGDSLDLPTDRNLFDLSTIKQKSELETIQQSKDEEEIYVTDSDEEQQNMLSFANSHANEEEYEEMLDKTFEEQYKQYLEYKSKKDPSINKKKN